LGPACPNTDKLRRRTSFHFGDFLTHLDEQQIPSPSLISLRRCQRSALLRLFSLFRFTSLFYLIWPSQRTFLPKELPLANVGPDPSLSTSPFLQLFASYSSVIVVHSPPIILDRVASSDPPSIHLDHSRFYPSLPGITFVRIVYLGIVTRCHRVRRSYLPSTVFTPWPFKRFPLPEQTHRLTTILRIECFLTSLLSGFASPVLAAFRLCQTLVCPDFRSFSFHIRLLDPSPLANTLFLDRPC